jgi:Crp-like helix-turn-helix protein
VYENVRFTSPWSVVVISVHADRAQRNQLLSALPANVLTALLEDLELREFRVKDFAAERDQPIRNVVFPLTAVLSTLAHGAEDQLVEVATVGNEGMAGIGVFLGAESSGNLETVAQVPGECLLMRTRDFRKHIDSFAELRTVLGLYTQALLSQISQASACNRMHPAEERCARWLLMTHDRVDSNVFGLTQEFLAQMLGVRRATVTSVASTLQDEGIIRYSRGAIEIVDRTRLEDRSCECYGIIRTEYERLLPARVRRDSRASG